MQVTLRQISYSLFLLFTAMFFISSSNGPPAGRSGAPGDSTCLGCHVNNGANGSVQILGIPNEVFANQTYSVTIRIDKTSGVDVGNLDRAGFQFVALDDNSPNGQSVGTFSNLGTNVELNTFGGRQYTQHGGPSENTFTANCTPDVDCSVDYTFDWTAPSTDVPDGISFYVGALVANGSGTNGDRFVTASIQDVPLPVELSRFEATKQERNVVIQWETTNEQNSDFFEVTKSVDGINYKVIGTVAAAGESNKILRYAFIDDRPNINKVNYYRLKQYDIDGRHSYSTIATVEVLEDSKQSEYSIFPNPLNIGECIFVEYISLNVKQDISVQIFDQRGQRVLNNPAADELNVGLNRIIIDSANMRQGIYYVLITSGNEKLVSEKVIVM